MSPKSGDHVRIETKDTIYEGAMMPSATDAVVIKLPNGYNVGIEKKKIKKITVVKSYKAPKKTTPKKKKISKEKKIKIALLHTGGTIASKIDYKTGAVVARFSPEEIVALYPELEEHANITSELISNILSENLRFVHIENIAKAIAEQIKKKVDGIIITHGTDTLGYSLAATSFMIDNPPIPIIFVGAQRSSDRGSSDAPSNLLCAVQVIKQTNFTGFAACMHHSSNDNQCAILPAGAIRKMHSSRRDAFRPINRKPYAFVQFPSGKIKKITSWKPYKGKMTVKIGLHDKVGLLKCHPNMHPSAFASFKGYKGLVIEGTGLGHAPIEDIAGGGKVNSKIKTEIQKLIKSGTIVVMTTQTIYGAAQMHVYSPGRALLDIGVLQSKMLSETALVKLAWLLKHYKKDKVKQLMETDLCGEMFYRIEDDTFLI